MDLRLAAQRVLDFIGDQSLESFSDDLKTQSAVIFQTLILGEASKRLSAKFRDRYPEISWSKIMRMRDRLIHHYEGMDPGEVWQAAKGDIPALLAFLELILKAEQI
ncbi:MAG TPA: DUF86 domain-containing protein [Thermoanaerobaculia bacterium]|nr:DUF86 domain-containing protein [Thermoanaerobaculia bacterium]